MPDIDQFGDILDPATVERWVKETLEARIVEQLAHQERRNQLDPRTIPAPKSWPTVSEFDPEVQERLPAITIISPGAIRAVKDRGSYRTTWRVEVAAAVAGKDEAEARFVASLYLTAIKGALLQNGTLGGHAEQTEYSPPDDHAFGITRETRGQRAIYGTAFEVTVRDTLNVRQGPADPLDDPYVEPALPEQLTEADITVTSRDLSDDLTEPEDTP